MKLKTRILIIAMFSALCLLSTTSHSQVQFDLLIPAANRLDIRVDGNSEDWSIDPLVCGFKSPWTNSGPDKTLFYASVSKNALYFCFIVEDRTTTVISYENEMSLDHSDRVELFFSVDESLSEYYCLEIDPFGNIMDYRASLPRKFDLSWEAGKTRIKTSRTKNSYIVEGKIKLKLLRDLNIKSQFSLGIFRADYYGPDQKDANWLTAKVPDSASPDFHIPSAFMKVKFQ